MMGVPVVIAENGLGVPVRPVDKDAPTLRLTTSGVPFVPFDASVISGSTWIRYNGSGDFTDGADYQVEFG